MGYKAALDAGADAIDLSLAPASGGTCQPDVATMWHALRGTDYDLDVDIDKVLEAESVFKECMKDYFLPPEATMVEPLIPWSPMPGGALTANTQMLRDNNMMDRYPEIIKAMKEVVERGGYGTSVTPVSQFYFQQAFNNVMFGPWKKIADGYGKMVLGYFGKTPTTPDQEIVKIASEQLSLEPTKKTALEINDADPSKGLAPAKKALEAANLPVSDENVFIAATCKDKGIMYLKGEAKVGVRKNAGGAAPAAGGGSSADGYTVTVGGKKFEVKLNGNKATVNGKNYDVDVAAGVSKSSAPAGGGVASKIVAPMPGLVLDIKVSEGDSVAEGDVVIVLEAMKMESPVTAHVAGTVSSIAVGKGDQVTAEQVLVELN
jgi:pyruvate carboxylase subunit B